MKKKNLKIKNFSRHPNQTRELSLIYNFIISYIFNLRKKMIKMEYQSSYYLLEFKDIVDFDGNSNDIFY